MGADEANTILIVEDEALIAMGVAAQLHKHGYQTLTALCGTDAVTMALGRPEIGLVLMDIDLGTGMDGTEAATRILAQREMPIIFLTNHAERDMVERVKGITRYGYVLKDAGEFVLIEAITMADELYRAHREAAAHAKRLETAVRSGRVGLWDWDLTTNTVEYSDEWKAQIGYGPEEVGDDLEEWARRVHPEDLDAAFKHVQQSIAEGHSSYELSFRFRHRGGHYLWILAQATIIRDGSGTALRAIGSHIDLTEQTIRETQFEQLLRTSIDGVWIMDDSGLIIDANAAAGAVLGYPVSQLIGMRVTELEAAETPEVTARHMQRIRTAGGDRFDTRLRRRDGSEVDVEASVSYLPAVGGDTGNGRFVAFVRDITDRLLVVADREVSLEILRRLGQTDDLDELLHQITSLLHQWSGCDAVGIRLGDGDACTSSVSTGAPFDFDHDDGYRSVARIPLRHGERTLGLLQLDDHRPDHFDPPMIALLEQLAASIALGLAQREAVHAERTHERFASSLLEAAPYPIIVINADRSVRYVNKALEQITGYDADELIGTTSPYPWWDEDAENTTSTDFAAALQNGARRACERFKRKDGSRFWVEITSLPVFEGDQLQYYVANWVDVTESRTAELELKHAVAEKEFLMRELNHRVKNNLGMVGSLLKLKQETIGKAADLSDIVGQLEAIRTVHDKLSADDQTLQIAMSDYLTDLAATICESNPEHHIDARVSAGEVQLPAKLAVAVGLIVAEAATNAVKHGFVVGIPAEFEVRMTETGEEYELRIWNSGRPVPDHVDLNHPSTLGLRLIAALTDQLGGTADIERDPSATLIIRFPRASAQAGFRATRA